MSIETSIAAIVEGATGQPYPYRHVELVEPDWTRFPGWKHVTAERIGASGAAGGPDQPYRYQRAPLVEPDWTRLPGFREVTTAEWAAIVFSICGGRSIDMVARSAWSRSRSA